MKSFTTESLSTIHAWVSETLKTSSRVSFELLNPDVVSHCYAGEIITIGGDDYLYRGYKALNDLAELHFCRMLTPAIVSDHTVLITFEKLDSNNSFHQHESSTEKYGTASTFSRIHKNEEPVFFDAYLRALQSVKVGEKQRILNLGINTGDEFVPIRQILPQESYRALELVGIDFSQSAIEVARQRFDEGNATFYVHDINDLHTLQLGRFDLIITIGTLQSSTLEFKSLFASLVQNHLSSEGAMILGFPNCRWVGGEMVYGAKAPNYPYSEMSILIKDIYYCKKYLQQKRFRVTVTGSDYLFLTATKIGQISKERLV